MSAASLTTAAADTLELESEAVDVRQPVRCRLDLVEPIEQHTGGIPGARRERVARVRRHRHGAAEIACLADALRQINRECEGRVGFHPCHQRTDVLGRRRGTRQTDHQRIAEEDTGERFTEHGADAPSLERLWGVLRETPQDKQEKIAKYTELLTPEYLSRADLAAGQKLYDRTCRQCHLLYGDGNKIGPDLTGSNRANLEYVLTNVIDPSAAIPREYRMVVAITTGGRVLTGMVIERTGERITLQTTNEKIVLVMEDIEELTDSPLSMMPEGQLDQLSSEKVRDLVAYLGKQR